MCAAPAASLEKEDVAAAAKRGKVSFDREIDRYEAKYILPSRLIPKIREYIRPFC